MRGGDARSRDLSGTNHCRATEHSGGCRQGTEYVIEKTRRVSEAHERSFKMYHEAGGKIAMGTDAGTPFNMHGKNAQELRYMAEYGMTPMDAIIASTANAADLMQLEALSYPRRGARQSACG